MTPAVAPMQLTSRWRYLADIFLLARIVAGLAIILAAKDGRPYLHHLSFVVGLVLVTWPVRGIRTATIYDAFLLGVVGAYVIVGLQWLIEIALLHGAALTFRASVIAPLTEEPLKILPLLLLVFVLPWRGRWSCGACDLMVLGVALGSGFGFVEDSLRHKMSYPDAIGPHFLGIPLTPDAHSNFIGHGGSAGFICLAIGWWVWMSRWKMLRVVAFLPAIFVGLWMMFDHGLANYSTFTMDRYTRWFWAFDDRGERAPYVFVAAVVLTLVVEWGVLLAANWKLRRVPLSRALAYARASLIGGFGYGELRMLLRRIRGVLLYLLARRQFGYLIAHRRGDASLDTKRYAMVVTETAGRVILAQEAIANP